MAETLVAWSQPQAIMSITPEMRDLLQSLARRFIERAETLDYTPAQRDFAACEFWVGATLSAALTNQTQLAETLGKIGSLEVMRRGYNAITEFAQ